MTKSRSPCFTSVPSATTILSRYPFTRARKSTDSTARVVPVNCSVSATERSTGNATVTVGGGGGANWFRGRQPATLNDSAAIIATASGNARNERRIKDDFLDTISTGREFKFFG